MLDIPKFRLRNKETNELIYLEQIEIIDNINKSVSYNKKNKSYIETFDKYEVEPLTQFVDYYDNVLYINDNYTSIYYGDTALILKEDGINVISTFTKDYCFFNEKIKLDLIQKVQND